MPLLNHNPNSPKVGTPNPVRNQLTSTEERSIVSAIAKTTYREVQEQTGIPRWTLKALVRKHPEFYSLIKLIATQERSLAGSETAGRQLPKRTEQSQWWLRESVIQHSSFYYAGKLGTARKVPNELTPTQERNLVAVLAQTDYRQPPDRAAQPCRWLHALAIKHQEFIHTRHPAKTTQTQTT